MKHEAVDPDPLARSGGINGPSFKLIALLVLAVAVAVFFFQNGRGTDIEFLWFDVNWPVRSVIVISVVAGVVLDRLFLWLWRRAKRRKAEQSAPPAP